MFNEKETTNTLPQGEELKKRKFFANFALKHFRDFHLHKDFDVLNKEGGWDNVSRHCLVVSVASGVLAEKLNLPEQDKKNLVQAALIHDFYKRREIELMKAQGTSAASLIKAEEESKRILSEKGFDPIVIKLTDSVGLTKIERMKEPDVTLLEKIMFYIDMITKEDNLVNLEERVAALPARYPDMAETGIYPTLLATSKKIEGELAKIIGLKNPADLPFYIKNKIGEQVDNFNENR